VNPDDLAQGPVIRMTRRRSSKKTAKNSNSLMKTMRAQARTDVVADNVGVAVEEDDVDEVVDVVGGGVDATIEETTCGTAAARRDDTVGALHARGRCTRTENTRPRSVRVC